MTSYSANQCENHADSNSFDTNVYTNLLLHPMVRSLMLEHNQEESKVEFGYYKLGKPSFRTQRREESKGEYERKRVTFGTHTQLNREESKEASEHRNGRDFAYLNRDQAYTTQSDWCINQERTNSHYIVRDSNQDRIESIAGKNTSSFERNSRVFLSLDPNGQETEERIIAPHRRRELNQERKESLIDRSRPSFQRADTRHLPQAQDSQNNQESINVSTQESELNQERTECLDNTHDPMLLKSAFRYRSLNRDSEDTFFRETVLKYRDLLRHYERRRLQRQSERLGIEYRPLLYLDTGFDDRGTSGMTTSNSHEEVERLCKRVRQHVSMIRHRIHSTQHDMDPAAGWEEFKEHSTTDNEWAEFTSEFCDELYQDPGDLPSLARVTSANESATDSVAFDPFPCKCISRDDAAWRDSDVSSDSLDVVKSPDVSKDESHTGYTTDTTISCSIEKVQTESVSTGEPFKQKETSRMSVLKAISELHKVLICANKSQKPFDEQVTTDSSSCTTPTTANCDDSGRSRSMSMRSIASFSKGSNKEWLRTSIGPEGNLTRKRDIEMHKWLNAGVIPGWDVAQQESARCGPMEMVFYDKELKNFKDQQ